MSRNVHKRGRRPAEKSAELRNWGNSLEFSCPKPSYYSAADANT
jgi:hypothetical protein